MADIGSTSSELVRISILANVGQASFLRDPTGGNTQVLNKAADTTIKSFMRRRMRKISTHGRSSKDHIHVLSNISRMLFSLECAQKLLTIRIRPQQLSQRIIFVVMHRRDPGCTPC